MRLVKIRDGRSSMDRTATYQELISNYVFPNGKPSKFIPGNYYTVGDFVYVVDDNNYATIYECISSGTSDTVSSANWRVVTLENDIRKIVEEYLGIVTKSAYVVDFTHTGYSEDDIKVVINDGTHTIKLPDDYNFDDHITLFINGLYKSKDLGDYSIVKIDGKYYIQLASGEDWNNSTVALNIDKPANHNAKLFGYVDTLPSTIVDTTIYFSLDHSIMDHSSTFELYHDGILVPDNMYNVVRLEEDGLLLLEISDSYGRVVTDEMIDAFVLSITTSRSASIKINRDVYHIDIDEDFECYRVELDDSITDTENIKVYIDHELLPYNSVYIADGVLSITRLENYGTIGKTMHIINDVYDVEMLTVKANSESIIVESGETAIPIPIINYDESVHDILVFKESGIYVSRSRYYVKDGYAMFYPHDDSLIEGETLYFQIFNEDESVSIRSKLIEYTDTTNSSINIPTSFNDVYETFLLFKSNGLYIPETSYRISSDRSKILFNEGTDIGEGDILEFVFNQYLGGGTNTITKISNSAAISDNTIQLPINNYNSSRYKIMLFNNTTGAYIDSSRYSISDKFVLTVEDGTGISQGDNLDIYFVVNLPSKISINTVKLEVMSL